MTATGSAATPAEAVLKLVGFRLDDWRFAVRLEQVQTSIMPCAITRVFHVPEYVLGIISLRGTIVGVLDLGRLLGLPGSSSASRRFLVVAGLGVQAALPVHDVFRVPDVPRDRIEPLPTSVTPAQKQYLEGVINTASLPSASVVDTGAHTLTLLDVAQLFESATLRSLRGKR